MRTVSALGARGKLHSWEEYVAIHAGDPTFVAFDQWVAENMDAALSRGEQWPSAYRGGRVHAFVHAPEGPARFLAGAITPSHDRAGRDYPLFAGTLMETEANAVPPLATLPLLLEAPWSEASDVVTSAVQQGTVAALSALVEAAHPAADEDIPGALESWQAWARGMRLDELAELLFGAEPAGLASALRNLLEAVAPHRGVFPLRTRLSLRLPLGRAGGAAVCFWLGVTERTLRWERVVPSFFWTHDGNLGQLLLYLGIPPRSALGQLWMPAPADDVVDLVAPPVTEHRAGTEWLEAVFATEGATVADLLDAV
jgi:type VI secretion system ImpM family protein